eukprot:TRINITY_DN12201_c0_g1_i1.p1 TRINITY_DN12201_c0_g1~~TRINITY_DN12201_c0_g1_i1.p1  ORF type:complete len:284 (+),score=82.36 TRINITY_DN12201_c0_g1_i1:697-1548(+)
MSRRTKHTEDGPLKKKPRENSVVRQSVAPQRELVLQANSFAERALKFFATLEFPAELAAKLPPDVAVMNPYREPEVMRVMAAYLAKYFNDTSRRVFCFGINPGRNGAGKTGVAFTSPGLLKEKLGIESSLRGPAEFSGQFVYKFIEAAYGTPEAFFRQFYINSLCPLGFLQKSKSGAWNNMNFYDTPALFELVKDFMVGCIKAQQAFGCGPVAICFGSGQNLKVFNKLNVEHGLFEQIIAVEHARYILQYKRSQESEYLARWTNAFRRAAEALPQPSAEQQPS